MYVVETCPKCGGDLDVLILTSNPPIPARRCRRCGWYWQGKMEIPVRVPFQPVEEVYTAYQDTVGNLHWTETHSGEHTVPVRGGET